MEPFGTITVAGRELLAKLAATEKALKITKIMVGSGKCQDEASARDLLDLVHPIAEGTSTTPIYEGDTMQLTAEYRSDLNGGLQEGFWLNEISVHAQDPGSDDIMLYYGSLGDYPVWVSAYNNGTVDVRRFPISITIGEGVEVKVQYNPDAFMTAEDANALINATVKKRLKTTLTVYGNVVIPEIIISASEWSATNGIDGYPYSVDIPIDAATLDHVPLVSLHPESGHVQLDAGVYHTAYALDGSVRLFAKNIPADDMKASVSLLRNGAFPKSLLYCEQEKGFLFNVFSDGDIRPAGAINPDPSIQTFENVVIADTGDASFSTANIDMLHMSIGDVEGHGNGVKIAWNGNSTNQIFPAVRIRLPEPKTEDAIGLNVYCKREMALPIIITLYACTTSLGTSMQEYGQYRVTPPNDGIAHHLRIPFTSFGITDGITLPENATAICLRISWNNAQSSDADGDVVWIDNVGFFSASIAADVDIESGGGTGGADYTLPTATANRLGGVKVGNGLSVSSDGTLSVDGNALIDEVAATDGAGKEVLDEIYGASDNN